MDAGISYIAVLVAAVVAYAIGAMWHSPVGFGKQWMHLSGFSKEHMHSMPLTAKQAMIYGFFFTLLFAYVFAHFILYVGANTLTLAFQMGFWVWLGFVVTTLANGWLWEGKSLKLFLFNTAYPLISIEAMAAVLVYMQ